MNRKEEYEAKSARYRKDYEKYKERMREKSRKWYWANREWALKKAAIGRQRRREESIAAKKLIHFQPSMEALEQDLPWKLRQNIPLLRKNFLKIPILERPPYDVYLKLKTIEYYKEISK